MKIEKSPQEIAEINKSRKEYEKNAKSTAKSVNSSVNSFVDNLLGRGIDKMDVMHHDALKEDAARQNEDEAELERQELVTQIGSAKIESWMSDDVTMKFVVNGKKMQFFFKPFSEYYIPQDMKHKDFDKIGITSKSDPYSLSLHEHDSTFSNFSGKIDGESLNQEQCIAMLNKYGNLISERFFELRSDYINNERQKLQIAKDEKENLADVRKKIQEMQ